MPWREQKSGSWDNILNAKATKRYGLCYVRLRLDTLETRLDPQSNRFRVVSCRLQSADHEPQVWNTRVSPGRIQFALLVHTPDRLEAVGDFVTKRGTNRVNRVGKPSGQDNQIVFLFPAPVEDDLVFGEATQLVSNKFTRDGSWDKSFSDSLVDVTLLHFDVPIDDLLTGASVEVEAAILGEAESLGHGSSLAAPRFESSFLHLLQQLVV